ncbi:hypothetical protein Tco_0645986 [Tanacetum coccineum]
MSTEMEAMIQEVEVEDLCALLERVSFDVWEMLPEESDQANDLMDQKVRTYAERQADNKRRLDNNPGDNHDQQPPFKRQNVARALRGGETDQDPNNIEDDIDA